MVRGRRGETSSSRQPFSSRQCPTASMRRRRLEGASQLPYSEPIGADYTSPSSVVPEHPDSDQDQPSHQPFPSKQNDISEPLPGSSQDRSILKSFKNHVAFAIWVGEVSFINFFKLYY